MYTNFMSNGVGLVELKLLGFKARKAKQWLWTWGGKCFGYREGNELWTYGGKHVGRFYEDEIYDSQGKYVGEIMPGGQLITNKSKKFFLKYGFVPFSNRMAYASYANYVGYAMYAGYRDFPAPESF